MQSLENHNILTLDKVLANRIAIANRKVQLFYVFVVRTRLVFLDLVSVCPLYSVLVQQIPKHTLLPSNYNKGYYSTSIHSVQSINHQSISTLLIRTIIEMIFKCENKTASWCEKNKVYISLYTVNNVCQESLSSL